MIIEYFVLNLNLNNYNVNCHIKIWKLLLNKINKNKYLESNFILDYNDVNDVDLFAYIHYIDSLISSGD
jgi:hypothetical protein